MSTTRISHNMDNTDSKIIGLMLTGKNSKEISKQL